MFISYKNDKLQAKMHPHFGIGSFLVLVLLLFGGSLLLFSGCPAPPVDEPLRPSDGKTVWKDETPIDTNRPDTPVDAGSPDIVLPPSSIEFDSIQVSQTRRVLRQVKIVGQSVVAAGEGIFFSEKEGGLWKDVSPSSALGEIYALAVHPKKQLLLAAGGVTKGRQNGAIFLSENGGRNWKVTKIVTSAGKDLRFRGVAWINPVTAIAVGMSGQVYRSTDSGTTWKADHDSLPASAKGTDWHSIEHIGSLTFLVGAKGTLLRSSSSGVSWTSPYSGNASSIIRSTHFLDENYGMAVGSGNLGLLSVNSGRIWSPVKLPVTFDDEDFLSVAGNGKASFLVHTKRGFWYSKNRGRFWRDYTITLDELPASDSLTHAQFSGDATIWFTTTKGTLLKGVFK